MQTVGVYYDRRILPHGPNDTRYMSKQENKRLAESNINFALALAVARHRLSMHTLQRCYGSDLFYSSLSNLKTPY